MLHSTPKSRARTVRNKAIPGAPKLLEKGKVSCADCTLMNLDNQHWHKWPNAIVCEMDMTAWEKELPRPAKLAWMATSKLILDAANQFKLGRRATK
jgi:hypothetical protein